TGTPSTTPTHSTTTTWTTTVVLPDCTCSKATHLGNNTFEIVPHHCSTTENITCSNGKTPVLLYDKSQCCPHYACDCECKGWGNHHYITFDGFYYNYQGNCTYVLMQEINRNHNLSIYIDNVFFDSTEDVSRLRSIIILNGSQIFNLTNHNFTGRSDLEVKQGPVILYLVITFGGTGFSVNLPYKNFGNNTQGHCGTCNNNPSDDCILSGGQLAESFAAMADNWTAKDIGQGNCTVPPTKPTSAPEPPPLYKTGICELLNSSLFAKCHPIISPKNFYKGCIFDSSNVNKTEVLCTTLQTYAAACARAGVCVYWRNHTKTEKCSYEPTMNFTAEGCFCPDGMKLFSRQSNICVKTCGKFGIIAQFNERFELKCQKCTCEESTKTVTCKPKECPKPNITECSDDGFVLINQTDPSDPCCSTPVCRKTCSIKAIMCLMSTLVCKLAARPHDYVYLCLKKICVCIYLSLNYLQQGEIWSPTENRCDEYTCVKNGEILTTSTSHTVCPVFNKSRCEPVSINFLIIHLVCIHLSEQKLNNFCCCIFSCIFSRCCIFSFVGHNSNCSKRLL
uniref:Mucin 5f n=1 Tax=Oreochromis aureus TaxID=47969 RepID=A0A668U9Q1_OREAU